MSAKLAPEILVDTVRYLEQQKARGVRFVHLSAEILQDIEDGGHLMTEGNPIPPPYVGSPSHFQKSPPPSPMKSKMSQSQLKEFETLQKKVLSCKKCPHLVSFRHQVVFGVGNPSAELMFVGEAPGADEDKQGEPFVGRAGQLLTKLIQTMGFERSDIYIANILKCRPNVDTPSGNRKPTQEEMCTCVPYLKEQIRLIQPKAIVALGDTAIKGLVPELMDSTIGKLRSHWQSFEGIPVMPTYHPSYLLRNQSLSIRRQWWEDMLAVLERLKKPISEKQRGFFLTADPNRRPA